MTVVEHDPGQVPKLKHEQVCSFASNEDLVDTLVATINLPGIFFRVLPNWRGRFALEGFFTSTMPEVGGSTVVVDLFGKSDIRPSKPLPLLWLVLPQCMEHTLQMMRMGYEDAKEKRFIFEEKGWRVKALAGKTQRS